MKNFWKSYEWPLMVLAVVVLINLAAQVWHTKLDLTEERRYSLSPATVTTIQEIPQPVFIQVLLEGNFPAGFKRLQNGVREMLDQFRRINGLLSYRFEDPMYGKPEEVEERITNWTQVGILPTDLNVKDEEGQSSKQIFPYAIFNYGDRQVAINLLERESFGIPAEVALNNSLSLLEYKFANALAKLQATHKANILFTRAQGELSPLQTAALESNLKAFYNTADIYLDSVHMVPEEVDLLVVAKPTKPFPEKSVFKLDQFIMRGGKVLFLIDPLVVNLDSIRRHGQYVPHEPQLNLDNLFFRYGFRVQPNLVLDLDCTTIPLAVDRPGSQSEYQQFRWFYHVLARGVSDHAITKGLDRVNLLFPATVDTVKTELEVTKTPLLFSSAYSRIQFSPVLLDFDIINQVQEDKFTGPPQVLSMLLEGRFTSLYKNRVSADMQAILEDIGAAFKAESEPTSILVVADGDVAKNLYNPRSGKISDLGFNQYVNYTFANKNFLTNAIEYMLDRRGLIETRAKTIKLRLLDRKKITEEKMKWQILNVVLPLIVLLVFGILFQYLRRRKYGTIDA